LKATIEEKPPHLAKRYGFVFHHDNARQHVSVNTFQILNGYGWDILNHPPFFLDMAASDYYLFWSIENSLRRKNFDNLNDAQNQLGDFFSSQNRHRNVTWTITKGSMKQWTLCNRLKLYLIEIY